MHLGSTLHLSLIIFAEFFCGIFLILGLFTRFACIPIIIGMCVVVFVASHGQYFWIRRKRHDLSRRINHHFILRSRQISVDGMIGK